MGRARKRENSTVLARIHETEVAFALLVVGLRRRDDIVAWAGIAPRTLERVLRRLPDRGVSLEYIRLGRSWEIVAHGCYAAVTMAISGTEAA